LKGKKKKKSVADGSLQVLRKEGGEKKKTRPSQKAPLMKGKGKEGVGVGADGEKNESRAEEE